MLIIIFSTSDNFTEMSDFFFCFFFEVIETEYIRLNSSYLFQVFSFSGDQTEP